MRTGSVASLLLVTFVVTALPNASADVPTVPANDAVGLAEHAGATWLGPRVTGDAARTLQWPCAQDGEPACATASADACTAAGVTECDDAWLRAVVAASHGTGVAAVAREATGDVVVPMDGAKSDAYVSLHTHVVGPVPTVGTLFRFGSGVAVSVVCGGTSGTPATPSSGVLPRLGTWRSDTACSVLNEGPTCGPTGPQTHVQCGPSAVAPVLDGTPAGASS